MIEGTFVPEVWMNGLRNIWENGHLRIVNLEGKPVETVEIMGLTSKISIPNKGAIPDGYIWKEGSHSWEDYRFQFLNPDNSGFSYTYGNRIRAWGAGRTFSRKNIGKEQFEYELISLDQVQYMIDELNRDKSSRRAVAVTWIPPIDEESGSPPCMMYMQGLIMDDYLHFQVPYRSHDFFGAYPANAYGLSGVMEYIAKKTNAEVGSLQFFSGSAHIYWFNWPDVSKLLGATLDVPNCKKIFLGRMAA
jgi:thymidylate synthase